jgi:hypothetical protein
MKLTVITDDAGSVLGTLRHDDSGEAGAGRLVAGPGQVAHEIELTGDMDQSESPEDLHRRLESHLRELGRNSKTGGVE